jgi:hypothetical protein
MNIYKTVEDFMLVQAAIPPCNVPVVWSVEKVPNPQQLSEVVPMFQEGRSALMEAVLMVMLVMQCRPQQRYRSWACNRSNVMAL